MALAVDDKVRLAAVENTPKKKRPPRFEPQESEVTEDGSGDTPTGEGQTEA